MKVLIWGVVVSLFLTGSFLQAESIKSTVTIHAGVETIEAGATFPVALLIELPDGWYTYAEDPGDAGMPPDIRMHAPEGVTIGKWKFPPHQTFTDDAGTYYGFKERVVLLSEITLPDSIPEGAAFKGVFDILWMICKDVCLPFRDRLTLTIPQVKPQEGSAKPADWNALLKSGGWDLKAEINKENAEQ